MAQNKLLKLSKKSAQILIISLGFCLTSFWVGDKLFPLNLTRYQEQSVVIYGENHQLLHVFLTKDDKFRLPSSYESIPPLYLKTLLLKEDRLFFYHLGINPFSLGRALFHNLKSEAVRLGGSTLTMQTARLLEPRPRTFWVKLIECFRALQLERHFSKKEILNIYLTLAPFGSNIEGIKAASFAYFNKSPEFLDPAEIALLVAIVQSPNRLRSDLYPQKAFKARNHVLQLMQQAELISKQDITHFQAAPLPLKMNKFPREIPHLAWHLRRLHPKKLTMQSTINLSLQKKIENLLKHQQSLLPAHANVAVLVLDHQQNKPVAYVGSLNFLDTTKHGFVDYIRAYRSPGSTLKPFIYGMAFDDGIIQPEHFLLDVHQRFGNYAPRNFDKTFRGMVQAKEALALSLNIPAVSLLSHIGVTRFISNLKAVGVTPKLPATKNPGLSSALGGLGLTLEHLVLLYSGLANQGKIKPFSYLTPAEETAETYFISAHAAQLLTNILAFEDSQGNVLAIKTGTSYGHRDALAIAYNHQYVIGIWIGAHNNVPMRGATGSTLAVPLIAKIYPLLLSDNPKSLASERRSRNQTTRIKHLKPVQNFDSEPLTLLFPTSNSVIQLDANSVRTIPCAVQGGIKPYTWLINGKLVASQIWQQKYSWEPLSAGYYNITVIDASGQSITAHIEVG